MQRRSLEEELVAARNELAAAEVAMDTALRKLAPSRRADKTAVTEPISQAFDSVRAARSVVANLLQRLAEEAEPHT